MSRSDYPRELYDKRKPYRARNEALAAHARLYSMYERVLTELAMNRYRWSGLPDGWDERFMVKALQEHGLLVVFRDVGKTKNGQVVRPGTDKLFALKAAPTGQLDMYENPTAFTITSTSGQHTFSGLRLSARVVVPIWSNYLRQTDYDIISEYAEKLAEVDRTIRINLKSARRSKILVYDENTRLSVENINRQIDSGEASIGVKYDIGTMMQALDLGVDPKSIETLSVIRSRFWSEAMGLLGINNANQDKKERLVEAEVGANEDQVDNMRFVALNAMQQACMKLRKMFPNELSNIWVEYRSDFMERELMRVEQQLGMEGGNSGDVHNGASQGS